MAETKDFQGYLKNKCIVGYGIANGIINGAIFFAMNASNAAITFDQSAMIEEIALTGALLGVLLTLCVVPLTKMDFKKGVYTATAADMNATAKLPGNMIVLSLVVGVIALAICTALAAVFSFVLPMPLTRTGMMIFKGCMCAIAGAIAGYLVIGRTTAMVVAE